MWRDVDVDVGALYRTPLSFGKLYVGQTGCYVNGRMREHANYLCRPRLVILRYVVVDVTVPLFGTACQYKLNKGTEPQRNFLIHKYGAQCVSGFGLWICSPKRYTLSQF